MTHPYREKISTDIVPEKQKKLTYVWSGMDVTIRTIALIAITTGTLSIVGTSLLTCLICNIVAILVTPLFGFRLVSKSFYEENNKTDDKPKNTVSMVIERKREMDGSIAYMAHYKNECGYGRTEKDAIKRVLNKINFKEERTEYKVTVDLDSL